MSNKIKILGVEVGTFEDWDSDYPNTIHFFDVEIEGLRPEISDIFLDYNEGTIRYIDEEGVEVTEHESIIDFLDGFIKRNVGE